MKPLQITWPLSDKPHAIFVVHAASVFVKTKMKEATSFTDIRHMTNIARGQLITNFTVQVSVGLKSTKTMTKQKTLPSA